MLSRQLKLLQSKYTVIMAQLVRVNLMHKLQIITTNYLLEIIINIFLTHLLLLSYILSYSRAENIDDNRSFLNYKKVVA